MGPKQNPFDPFKAGQIISAKKLNEVAEDAFRGAQIFAAGRMRGSRVPGGPPVLDVDLPEEIYARITGQGSGCAYSGTSGNEVANYAAGPNCYCGIEWGSDKYGGLDDVTSGLIFDAFGFPLVEMTGRDDVPVDAIVRAYRARAGDHYEFVFTGEMVGSGEINACGCCCCCVPCLDAIWLTVGTFYISGCGLPATASGIGPAVLVPVGNCYVGGGTVTDGWGTTSTMTWTAKVCCDPNDKRRCPVLQLNGRLVVPSGEFAGTYDFCIGPIDFEIVGGSQTEIILNCRQADPVYAPEPADPINWQAVITTATWSCDPNGVDCQCQVTPVAGQSITIECLCQACPITGIPDTLTADIAMGHDNGCAAATGNIVTTITLTHFANVPASGTPCTVTDDYGQPCWYGESEDLGEGCRIGLLLLCRPLSLATGEFGITLCTIQDPGGNCATMNAIISTCWNLPGQTTTVCCNPFGIIIANLGGFPYITIGNPTCV